MTRAPAAVRRGLGEGVHVVREAVAHDTRPALARAGIQIGHLEAAGLDRLEVHYVGSRLWPLHNRREARPSSGPLQSKPDSGTGLSDPSATRLQTGGVAGRCWPPMAFC